MVFLDVGANIGLFSIYAQSIGAQVIAVEAMDTNAQFITASECMNSVTHGAHAGSIYLFHYAAHPAPDDADCSIRGATLNRDNGELWCRDKKDGNNAGQSSEKQQLARLDSMVQEIRTHGQLPFEQIDLMKIDVEGFEQAVMESASGMSYPPKGIVFECNAKQSKARNHNTLFWRRYLMDNHGYCNGFTYATGEDPFILQLIFPYFPFIDAIALGTCGGGNFYLDCSGFMGEGVLLFSYRWSIHVFFIVSFIRGMRMIIAGQRHSRGGSLALHQISSLIRKRRFLLVCSGIVILAVTCTCRLLFL
jgi:FkbM family methyltransferase